MSTKEPRKLFSDAAGIYALSHSVGPLPLASKQAVSALYFDQWSQLGGDAWPAWLASIDDFCDAVAQVLKASADEICPQNNLASGFTSYLSAIAKLPDYHHKRVVLMHEEAFASMGFVVNGLAHSHGLSLELLSSEPNDTRAWTQRLAKGDVLACLFTHVHSNTSVKSDISSLIPLAKAHGAFALVDVAQSVGVVPIDVKAWKADAVFGSCVKWLCGGPGAGFMYINEDDIAQLEPDLAAWFSHENPFEFDIRHYQPSPTAKRFFGGTPSVAPFICAASAIRTILSIGVNNIAAHNLHLKRYLLAQIQHISAICIKPEEKELDMQGGSLCIGVKDMAKAAERLQKAGVRFDQRGNIFRLSLHIMNTSEEADIIAQCLTS